MDTIIGGLNSVYNNSSNANSSANAIEKKLNNTDLSGASDDELMDVCKDFEEYFVEQMVKSMMKMAKVDGGDDENDYSAIFGLSDSSGSYMSTLSSFYGDQMVTKISEAISGQQGGGLGLAQTLYEQMKRNYSVEAPEDTTEPGGTTEIPDVSGV